MSEKTEQPTAKRLREARQKGQVAKSKEIGSTAILVGLFGIIWMKWDFYLDHLKELVLLPTKYYGLPFEEAFKAVVQGTITSIILICLPVLLVAVVLALVADFFQVGFLFATESVKPDIKKINPAEGLKKLFSLKSLIELIKSIIKISFLGILLYFVLKDSIDPLFKIPHLGLPGISWVLAGILKKLVIYTSAAYLVIALADYVYQRYDHIKQLKMSKEEVKQEYKEMEGDPQIKGKRRQLHRELVMSNMLQKVKKASVVITNPTRIAVALLYDQEETKLPLVVAKGENLLAKRIIEVAQEEGIPIMQNVPLAQDLYAHGELDQYIPSELIGAVAEVLRWVQQLQRGKQP